MADIKDRTAHRGYYIVKSFSTDTWYISKDGHHISSAPSLDAAKIMIDALLEGRD